jgi:hypothetical protein
MRASRFIFLTVMTLICSPDLLLGEQLILQKVGDSVIDPEALHFTNGSWGVCVNGQTFQQDAVTTFKGFQYATYYDAARHLCVARRPVNNAKWEILRFTDYFFKGTDTHNVAVVGVCPRDGTIHLSFDHHGHPLHYRVSIPGVASRPHGFAWTTNLFSGIRSELEPGRKLTRVTYPRFVRTPGGGLQFGCRIGGSGDGDKCLADYDPRRGAWGSFGACFGGTGDYLGQPSRNAYLNGYTYDRRGNLHVTWCWRETGDPTSNHDLDYAWSKNGGRTWLNNAGNKIGERGHPVNIDSPGARIVEIAMGRGLMNAMTQGVDSRNRIHLVTLHIPDGKPGQPDWEATRRTTHYFHYWRDEQGRWKRNEMDFVGSRPQLWFDKRDNAYLIFVGDRFNPSPNLSIAAATAKHGWTDWKVIHTDPGPFSGQPQIDRYTSANVLSIYIQEAPKSGIGTATPLRVIDFSPTR